MIRHSLRVFVGLDDGNKFDERISVGVGSVRYDQYMWLQRVWDQKLVFYNSV